MTVMIRHLRSLLTETKKKPFETNKSRRKSLTVTISKEPPVIVYYERDRLEDTFECIFDPQVCHDEEKDHPDLFEKKPASNRQLKPWQQPPYCDNKPTLMSRFKSTFRS
ncbi:hypothetical protein BD560DRAFT_409276 [Blakeslea trispora]|nr:hypothetical protein BD560DRAFT_409276 [Blakeslea trispora]